MAIYYSLYVTLIILYPYILYVLWHWLSNMIYSYERIIIKYLIISHGFCTYILQYLIYKIYPLGSEILLKFNCYFEKQITLKSYILTFLQAEFYIYMIGLLISLLIGALIMNETKKLIKQTRWWISILLLLSISWFCPPDLIIQFYMWILICVICEIVFFFACLLKQYIN